MIEFKIISSPDRSQLATYQHMGSEITFGKSEGDMLIDDPSFGDLQLRVRLDGEKSATLENLNESVEIRLNGKPVKGVVPMKEKDNLTVARTTINFSRLDSLPLSPPERYEHPSAKERFAPGTKEHAIQEALAFLEQGSASSSPPPLSMGTAGPPPLPGAKGGPPKPPLPPPIKKN